MKRVKRAKVCWQMIFLLIHSIVPLTKFLFLQAASMSITSVLYLKDEVSIATAGAVDRYVRSICNVTEKKIKSWIP